MNIKFKFTKKEEKEFYEELKKRLLYDYEFLESENELHLHLSHKETDFFHEITDDECAICDKWCEQRCMAINDNLFDIILGDDDSYFEEFVKSDFWIKFRDNVEERLYDDDELYDVIFEIISH